ncbi:MAG: LysM peptidoglycan-binding domain-containing protein [Pyrinomonadaceae bacterium]
MNFAFDYVKHKSKPQNDGFYFDIETPSGHFFAVLDFTAHDYANLNPSLKGKLETIVNSFVSVSSFSADLFLGFLAKEINNFAHNLAEQSGGPELSCNAALCLVSGDRLSYFLRGDTEICILNSGRVQQLSGTTSAEAEKRLGAENTEAPMSDQVQDLTLLDDDVVLVMTRGVAELFESQQLPAELMYTGELDSQLLCDSLMKAGEASGADRTLVVISGPYERQVDPRLTELSQFEQRFSERFAALKEDLSSKAGAIDLLELDEKVRNLSATLAGKADTAAVLGLQRDVLKLGLISNAPPPNKSVAEPEPSKPPVPEAGSTNGGREQIAISELQRPAQTAFTLKGALIVVVISLAAGLVGGWLGSRRARVGPEVWSVKTSGNQITIGRTDVTNGGNVTLTVVEPLRSAGEQTFSSFADVQRYLTTITSPATSSAQTSQSSQPTPSTDSQSSPAVTEITVKPGDSLKRLAQVYNVPPEKLMELNPGVTKWPQIRIGQKIFVPSPTATATPAPPSPRLSPQADQSPAKESPANTTEVTVGPGDSLNELARRFNTTAERLKELNPHLNWPRIQSGQKVLVPTPAGG